MKELLDRPGKKLITISGIVLISFTILGLFFGMNTNILRMFFEAIVVFVSAQNWFKTKEKSSGFVALFFIVLFFVSMVNL